MPVALTYPGVYVQEVPSGVRTIMGVGTSIGLFIGRARKGELYKPVQCLSYEDFDRAFTSMNAGGDLARAVRLFFQNGGTQCYVARIADEHAITPAPAVRTASINLLNEGGTSTLMITARSPGSLGNDIRVGVDYNTEDPEGTFNLEVFRWVKDSSGADVKTDAEYYVALSMDPNSSRYVVDLLEQQSKLLKAADLAVGAAANGISLSGRALAAKTATMLRNEVTAILKKPTGLEHFQFMISVDGQPAQMIDLADLDFTVAPLNTPVGFQANLEAAIQGLINPKVSPSTVTVKLANGPTGSGASNTSTRLLRISSANGDVKITRGASTSDIAGPLMLGTSQGGTEISVWADARPAPNGTVFQPKYPALTNYMSFANRAQAGGLLSVTVSGKVIQLTVPPMAAPGLETTETNPALVPPPNTQVPAPGPAFFEDANSYEPGGAPPFPNPASDGVREKWGIIAAEIRKARTADPHFPWTAEVWGNRLAILAATGNDNALATVTGSAGLGAQFNLPNARYYSLGTSGVGPFQAGGIAGNDGNAPVLGDYQAAYDRIDREIDLFNLLVLPDAGQGSAQRRLLWGPASNFCLKRRALLLMDPPDDWDDSQEATDPMIGVATLRPGLVKDYAAVFYPNLLINEAGVNRPVGPSGAIAGLMARIDSSRGVWKAPAGTEADLRGVVGLEHRFSDAENGVMNPKAVNTLRVFPNGIVNWGARTMDGDDSFASEYKYIPIRRLALYIEESLYRGIKWVVFEPNDEPLWAQIRLNVGAFMNNLFRQGAFQGQVPKDAYFVKCDATTTTQNDRNLGIVNIVVGFAPLKPAEFVVLTLQQMAGQIQV